MKLSISALTNIDNQTTRLKLALALGFSETWVRGLINKNKDNGPLTTAMALEVIRQETGLTDEQILEREPVETRA